MCKVCQQFWANASFEGLCSKCYKYSFFNSAITVRTTRLRKRSPLKILNRFWKFKKHKKPWKRGFKKIENVVSTAKRNWDFLASSASVDTYFATPTAFQSITHVISILKPWERWFRIQVYKGRADVTRRRSPAQLVSFRSNPRRSDVWNYGHIHCFTCRCVRSGTL